MLGDTWQWIEGFSDAIFLEAKPDVGYNMLVLFSRISFAIEPG